MKNWYCLQQLPKLQYIAVLTMLLSLVSYVQAAPGEASLTNPASEHIDFTVSVLAEDPFASKNQAEGGTPSFHRGEVVRLVLLGRPHAGMHTYPITQRAPAQPEIGLSKLTFDAAPGLRLLGGLQESMPEEVMVPNVGVLLEYGKPFAWQQDFLLLPEAVPGVLTLHFVIRLQVCSNTCVWEKYEHDVPILVNDAAPTPLTETLQRRLTEKALAIRVVKPAGVTTEPPVLQANESPRNVKRKIRHFPLPNSAAQYRDDVASVQQALQGGNLAEPQSNSGLLRFTLTGVFWGFVSLLTPCVFPMIPITVSFFLKQSEKEHHRPLTLALTYCSTIIVVLTIAAVALLSFFRWLSVHPLMNVALGGLFIFFALSLFGMYEIGLPSGLAQFTSAREGRGGLLGTVFMALTFTIISFACVAPFLGGFGGTAAANGIGLTYRFAGGVAFASTFAMPFFVLALFPTLLKKLPKSGGWLNSVKVAMGFLELAAALKFFRAGELMLLSHPVFFTYDLVLGIWIAASVFCGAYLLNFFRLPHDGPVETVSVPRMLFALSFVSLAFYLLPAELQADAGGRPRRPSGSVYAWINSFLLPEPQESKGELAWGGNLRASADAACTDRKQTGQRRRIFLDFTGETCTNCKMNESTVFTRPEVRQLLARYQLVQLYTDKVPEAFYSAVTRAGFNNDKNRQREDAERNSEFEESAFGTAQLPFYVILEPEVNGKLKVVGHYSEGKINNEIEFARFLQEGLESANR
jgi:thiol:disulfide interchange protein DsbD